MKSTLLAQGVKIGDVFKIGEEGIGTKGGYSSIGEFVGKILPNVFVVAGVIFFILILVAGFGIITSAGDPEKTKQSSGALSAAIAGFIIIFGSYWIIQLIQYLTGVNILNPGV